MLFMSYNCFIITILIIFYNLFLQEIAKRIRPNTIRAHFGKSKVENAVHVTDLPEDSLLEVPFFSTKILIVLLQVCIYLPVFICILYLF